jgi:hypothetical protein
MHFFCVEKQVLYVTFDWKPVGYPRTTEKQQFSRTLINIVSPHFIIAVPIQTCDL